MDDREFKRERRKQCCFERIGTNKPRCPDCGTSNWWCFTVASIPQCKNCHLKAVPRSERAKARRLKELGTARPICAMCGETDWRCLEAHHVAGQRRDETTVILCANDHMRMSEEQRDHPTFDACADPLLDRVGHFLLGLADMLRVIVDALVDFGNQLIARAQGKLLTAGEFEND
jgi:hypothetical protein